MTSELASGPGARGPGRWPLQAAAGLGVVGALVLGVVVWGRIARTDREAMALTGLWFVAVLVAAYLLTRRRRDLRVPVAMGYALTAGAAFVLLGLPMLRDRQVDEQVVLGVPAAAEPAEPVASAVEPPPPEAEAGTASEAPDAASPAPPAADEVVQPEPAVPPVNVELARGAFVSLAHESAGTAATVQLPDGTAVLTLVDFATDNGPDLRVYLTAQDPAAGGGIGEFADLGALKGNVGNQQYAVGPDIDLARYTTAVIWCRAFAVAFASAPLAPSA